MIQLKKVKVEYTSLLLDNIDIKIQKGCCTLLRGLSGSGKTALLYRIGLISDDTNFEYKISDTDIMLLNDKEKSSIRKKYLIFVLQDSSLFEQYDVLGNLELYATFNDMKYSDQDFRKFLDKVHLDVPFHQSIQTLSGGEKQRLAIACALCKNSDILILDEPTNSLDIDNAKQIFSILNSIAHDDGKYVIITCHAEYALEYADVVYEIKNCQLLQLKNHSQVKTGLKIELFNKKMKNSFYFQYIRYFAKKYKKLVSLLGGIICFSLIAMNISLLCIDEYMNNSKENYLQLSENQMFITKDKNLKFINDDLENFNIFKSHQFQNNEKIRPYMRTYASINGTLYPVIPLFEENHFKSKELLSFSGSDIYLSFSIYRELANMSIDTKEIPMELVVEQNGHNIPIKEQIYSSIGVLKNNVNCPCLNGESKYIYVDYSLLEEIYINNNLNNQDEYIGYSVFTNNFEDYTLLYEDLSLSELGINVFFESIEELNTLMNNIEIYRIILILAILLMTLITFNIIELNYYYKRQKEFALLKINGVDKKGLLILTVFEMLGQFFVSLLINLGVLWLTSYFYKGIPIFNMLRLDFVVIGIVFLSSTIFNGIYINKLIPEKILRQ